MRKKIFLLPHFIKGFLMFIQSRYIVTKSLINWMYHNADCYQTPLFSGYIFTLQPKLNIGMLVNISGAFALFLLNGKKLKKRMRNKALKYLLKFGFIQIIPVEPFEEFEFYTNIPLNTKRLITKLPISYTQEAK